MKKQLLIGAMLMGAFFTANAQYTTSFEEADGFEAGPINGQNDWISVTDNEDNLLAGFEVVEANASEGEYSLSLTADTNYNPLETGVGVFAATPIDASFAVQTTYVDVYITEDEDEETDGANFAIQHEGSEFLTSRLEFTFDHGVIILEPTEEADYVVTEFTWEPNTWMTVAIEHDFDNGTINYYIDGELIYEGTFWTESEENGYFVVLHDNWPGSTAHFDNVSVEEGTMGTNDVLAAKFSVFPNPASDVINIANAENILVNGVTIADINGRTVKSAQFAGVANASVNVSDLASGVYMMTVTSDKGTAVKKIVKN